MLLNQQVVLHTACSFVTYLTPAQRHSMLRTVSHQCYCGLIGSITSGSVHVFDWMWGQVQ